VKWDWAFAFLRNRFRIGARPRLLYTFAMCTAVVRRLFACLLIVLFFTPLPGYGWGNEGHRMINRLAASSLPADVPVFLHGEAAIHEIEYLGPEPDRWRSRAEPELSAAQAPEHFIDLELADALGPLPRNRLDFEASVFAHAQRPEKIGLQPWETLEVWQRLKAAMREYRAETAAKQDTRPVEAAVLFYAGWLGHYVGDGAQPLHTSIHYNGWALKENPNGYTTEHTIHWRFEGDFVGAGGANIQAADVQKMMTAPQAISGDVFDAYVAYLRQSATLVERVYVLDKADGFVKAGSPESRAFAQERLAAGASMLRDMIYTAWLRSAEPTGDRY